MTRSLIVALIVGFGVPGSWFLVHGSAFGQRAGTRNEEPGARHPAPGTGQPAPGTLRVGIQRPDGGYSLTTMPLETYVARVLAGEAARDSRPAALEALAIAIRTFALANRGRHQADDFDLCDQTHCQVLRAATAATERAAQATAGRLLLRDRVPASIYYTASCGGRTEIPSAVWPGAEDPPFLPSQDDDACEGAPAWSAELREADLVRALRAAGFQGDRLRDMRIVSRSGSGRVARLRLEGLRPEQISGQDLRVAVGRALGWQHIKSTAFELRRQGDAFRFTGHGSGHGVGLCVIGSARLAEQGRTAEAILGQYFPGLEISRGGTADGAGTGPGRSGDGDGSVPGVVISLPDEDEGERRAIVRRTLRARDEMAEALGVVAPPRIAVRVHATADDYERATGQAWFTTGALVNNELHLLPLAVLRDRGVLDRTIRHELVHLMTNAALRDRPMWVREGAATYFADREAAATGARPSCPDDNELRHPVSAGTLTTAYVRARACFAKQIEQGRSWRDVH